MKDKTIKLTGMLIAAIFISHFSMARQDDNEFHLDETYSMSKTGKLWMNPEDANIEIIGSDRSDIHVKIDRIAEVKGLSAGNKEFSVSVESKDGDIFIKEKEIRTRYFIGFSRLEYTILVELPQGASLIVTSDDSDYEVTNVNGFIDMKLDDGDAKLRQCNGSRFEFDLDDVNLELDGGNGEIYAQLDDGNAYISGASFDDVNLKVDDGSITLETVLADQGSYELRGDDARIELIVLSGGGDITVNGDDSSVRATADFREIEVTERRNKYSLPGGNARVRIDTDDGRVRIKKASDGL